MTKTCQKICCINCFKSYWMLQSLKIFILVVILVVVSYRLCSQTYNVSPIKQDSKHCPYQTVQNEVYSAFQIKSKQSSNCDSHFYTKKDVGVCSAKIYKVRKRVLRVMVIGDTEAGELLEQLAKMMDLTCENMKQKNTKNRKILRFDNETSKSVVKYGNTYEETFKVCTSGTLHMQATHREVEQFKKKQQFDKILRRNISPDFVLVFLNKTERTEVHREDIRTLNERIKSLATKAVVIWIDEEYMHSDQTIKETINNTTKYFRSSSDVMLKDVSKDVVNDDANLIREIHSVAPSHNETLQSLFNFYCNPVMRWGSTFCCNDVPHFWSPPPKANLGIAAKTFLVSGFLILFCTFVRCMKKRKTNCDGKESCKTVLETSWNVLKMTCIISYFILCEKDKLFEESSKSNISVILLLISLAFGLMSVTASKSDGSFLNVDVTSEWKGWMQIMILIYHYSGLSRNLMVYMHIRILVAAYIFLTGFGHYSYASTGKPMGLKRYINVMFRINFLTVLLCLSLSQSYINYYFVPLVSFWFTVIYWLLYVTMNCYKRNTQNEVPTNNIILSVLLIIIFNELFPYRHSLELLFGRENLNISHEWIFRTRLDRFSSFTGVLFGLFVHCTKTSESTSIGTTFCKAARLCLSLVGLSTYVILSSFCGSKEQCNSIHPFISWIPIVCYISLRHADERFSKYHSKFFSWVGTFSLELFLCQYHIWMSDNTHHILILIPDQYVLNVILTTVSLFLISHELHKITAFAAKLLTKFIT